MDNTPVLFLIFNRPDVTRRVFAEIRRAAPRRLYIACDGPRPGVPEDKAKVDEVRRIVSDVCWSCDVKTLFKDKNLGCKAAVSSAIDWFFQQEEEGIILEDDCLPDQSFFPFCAELLKKYRDDERVMTISGDNFMRGRKTSSNSYYFSKYVHIWGWASWRRAWKNYDVSMHLWPKFRAEGFLQTLDPQERLCWQWSFDQVFSGRLDTWDHQWTFACWVNKGLAAMPEVNLVSNIGFGSEGTHTKKGGKQMVCLPTQSLSFPLNHPDDVAANRQADEHSRDIFFRMSAFRYARWSFKQMIGIK